MNGKPRAAPLDDTSALAFLAGLASSEGDGAATYRACKDGLRAFASTDPFDATVVTVLGGSFLFYLAEKGQNPKVRSFFDALVFVSTCLSVGYADTFARTSAGKAIAAAVMTFGPALSGAIFEAPKGKGGAPIEDAAPAGLSAEQLAIQKVIVEKLEAILGELRAART